MIFSSFPFLIFFLIYCSIWALTPTRFRLYVLIFGSLIFYGFWNWSYALLPVFLTLLAYLISLFISKNENYKVYKVSFGIFLILIPLVYFKYFDFLISTNFVNSPLPLGISFITFTLISYVVDVSKKSFPIEKSFPVLLGYILFFPQLIAGPILRPKELIPQLKNFSLFEHKLLILGIAVFTLGLGKKLIFADQIAPYVDVVYTNPLESSFTDWLIAFYGFPVQIYNDFSGYSDMAIGLGLMFGIKLPVNFNRPYLADSISELWRRWHITLSNWFRDYVYIPLSGRKPTVHSQFLTALFTMSLVGIWHGAGWNFVIWGIVNGFCVAGVNLLRRKKINLPLSRTFKVLITFHWWAITVVLFRSSDLSNAMDMYAVGLNLNDFNFHELTQFYFPMLLMLVFFITHRFDHITIITNTVEALKKRNLFLLLIFIWLVAMALSLSSGGSQKFIYFDF